MDLRITPQTTLANVLAHLSQQTGRMGKLQEQSASGKKVNRPSDDPIAVGQILASKAQDSRLDTYITAIQESRSSLNVSVSALQEAGSILGQARNIALESAQATYNAEAREALAQQVDRLLNRMLEVANTQFNGRYLFSGQASGTKPFTVTASDLTGRPLTVSYAGGAERNAVPISPEQAVATLYSGADVFQQRQRGTTVFTGSTGAAPGTGTDNGVGEGTLQVRHTTTTYAGGSGVQAGTSSAAGDTILGPAGAHQLTVIDTSGTGAFGTIALDGGPAVAFTNADTDLKITLPSGETVFVSATAITPGFSGTVNITANGTLSVDGGATTVPINFSANQIVTDSVTGAVTNIDSTGIRRAGAEHLDYEGTYDVFGALAALRDDLRNTRGLSEPEQIAVLSRRVGEFDRVHGGILGAVGEQSAELQQLDALENHVRDVQLSTKALMSDLEDADLSEIIVQMQAQQNQLQLTLAVAARLQDPSLLDFLRQAHAMLTIYIDADACPVKDEVYRVARRYTMRVVVVAKVPLWTPESGLVELVVRPDFGAVDDWIAEQAGAGDLVVTADIPLAARCLAKGARVLDAKGHALTDNDIGSALAMRELMAELRQSGTVTGGPAPMTPRDRSRFLAKLDEMINALRREAGK